MSIEAKTKTCLAQKYYYKCKKTSTDTNKSKNIKTQEENSLKESKMSIKEEM